jgi:Chalcone isomerase-like
MNTISRITASLLFFASLSAMHCIAETAAAPATKAATPQASATLTLPQAVIQHHEATRDLTKRGEAVMRFFGLKVYDIRLWTANSAYQPTELYALELIYALGLKGDDIANRSVDEMRKQGWTDESQLTRWRIAMKAVFPDVKKGDTLVGVAIPGKGAKFYSQHKFIGEIADADFARAFFDIWLSDKTSEPKLRTRLLGNK